ncbi:MAG: DUF4185 domain-containing protein [Deltaproteobacteria bacterium]|nr:MAG: DUF4185 domain-containing protein [Deltaproteobacteria bacterium]
MPDFPYRDGWLGGDAAYSVPLDAERSVWLFGDSFAATRPGDGAAEPEAAPALRRSAAGLVFGNSIAISRCGRDGTWQIEYHFGAARPRGAPKAFFDPPFRPDGHFYWPLDAFLHDGALHVGLLEVSADWSLHGTALARVPNPRDPPERWHVEYVRMSEQPDLFPGFAMVVDEPHVYLFASIVRGREPRRRVLTRLPLDAIAARVDAGASLESAFATYSGGGHWTEGLSPGEAEILMDDSATEMSVRFHPAIGHWVAIYSALPPHGAGEIVYRTAPRLVGPWSAPETLYAIPRITHSDARFDPQALCYAAKEHAAFRAAGRGATPVVITYVCNSASAEALYADLEIYRPIVLRDAFELRPPVSVDR